jgi:Zn-dependent peptidase ImmA (M78 family)/transcriptional regulator with XRE-family HTH domain
MSQKELAERVGITPPPMNALERGRHYPSTPLLMRLAKALDVSLDQLAGGQDAPYVVDQDPAPSRVAESVAAYLADSGAWPTREVRGCRARVIRLEPTPPLELEPAVIARLDAVVNAFLALEDICGVPKRALIPLCLPRPGTETGLETMVNRVRAMLGVAEAVIFDYLELFENAGLRVVFLPLPESVPSACCYDPDSENAFFLVRTGPNMTVEHQLFRLAYELGRIYLHVAGVRAIALRQPAAGKTALDPEHAARRFAAFFLMPAEAVHATVRQLGVPANGWDWDLLLRLKHRFGVSAETFLYRLLELDLIQPDLVEPLKIRIKTHYAETGNQEPDGSRRVLSPNGRLGDLLHLARRLPDHAEEVGRIADTLQNHGVGA